MPGAASRTAGQGRPERTMQPLSRFLGCSPRACEIAAHDSGPALVRIFLQVHAGAHPTLHAFHLDPEGSWQESADATALAAARGEDEFHSAAAQIRFPSSLPFVPNRYNELVRAAGPWFAQLS